MQAYFWRANAKYFFAILDSQSRGRLGRDRNSTRGVVDRREDGGGRGRGKKILEILERKYGSANYC